MAEFSPKLKEALSLVQKPGRYTGGEPGCTPCRTAAWMNWAAWKPQST